MMHGLTLYGHRRRMLYQPISRWRARGVMSMCNRKLKNAFTIAAIAVASTFFGSAFEQSALKDAAS